MDSQTSSASGSGFSQPGGDMGQLPPIHAPETFRAPDTQASHFAAGQGGQLPTAPPPLQPMQSSPTGTNPVPAPVPTTPVAAAQAQVSADATPAAPAEDTDTEFDEVWVNKAREVVGRTHIDPFLESKELSKLKAQYIKARYNKDIKTSEG